MIKGVGEPSSSEKAAAKRKPDRAQPQVKRRTLLTWTVGPTLIKGAINGKRGRKPDR
jgi:hypothetical protein